MAAANIKIVDNKKLSMTEAEYEMYKGICQSYDRSNFKGEDLFKGLFETDDNGIILLLKPPTTKQTSMEVFLFLVALFQQQHTRIMYDKVGDICIHLNKKIALIDNRLKKLDK